MGISPGGIACARVVGSPCPPPTSPKIYGGSPLESTSWHQRARARQPPDAGLPTDLLARKSHNSLRLRAVSLRILPLNLGQCDRYSRSSHQSLGVIRRVAAGRIFRGDLKEFIFFSRTRRGCNALDCRSCATSAPGSPDFKSVSSSQIGANHCVTGVALDLHGTTRGGFLGGFETPARSGWREFFQDSRMPPVSP